MARCVSCGNQASGWLFPQCYSCKQESLLQNGIRENNADERAKYEKKHEKKDGGC